MYQHLYSEFLKRNPNVKHFTCHTHHHWPDVTRDAMLEYWEDSARLVNDKWDLIWGEKVPETQRLITKVLNFSRPKDICFAPNTYDFVIRLLSCLSMVTLHFYCRRSVRKQIWPQKTLIEKS